MSLKSIGSGTFVCPMCASEVRFKVDIEAEGGNLYSSRVKGVSADHAPACKAYAAEPEKEGP